MRQFYSPFIDRKGAFLSLPQIKFSHILQLKTRNIDEGYQIEYKSRWDDNFTQKHLCQTIASFSNSEGGWLIIGIEDGTGEYVGIDKLRTDFSQIISQKLCSTTSPMPKFECRFIHETSNKRKGVLIIYIYEGLNPPYICNGTVYMRNGSSKVPIKPGRIEIDNLIRKRENYIQASKDFCVNSFCSAKAKFPFCSIYLYNPHADSDVNKNIDKLQNMKSKFSASGAWQRVSYSAESVICYNSDAISKSSNTAMIEFFVDGNIKIFCPLFPLSKHARASWANYIQMYAEHIDLSEMQVIDGYISYMSVQNCLLKALDYIKECNYHINDYNISFEYTNVDNTVLFFRTTQNSNNTDDEFYICPKHELKISATHFVNDVDSEGIFGASLLLMDSGFSLPLGIDPYDMRNKLVESQSLYTEKVFSTKFDF